MTELLPPFILGWVFGMATWHLLQLWLDCRGPPAPRCRAMLSNGHRCELDRSHSEPHRCWLGRRVFYWPNNGEDVTEVERV